MFYTRSNGMRVPATVVGFAPDGLLHLECFQDAVKVVHRQCKVESISFAIRSADSPQASKDFDHVRALCENTPCVKAAP